METYGSKVTGPANGLKIVSGYEEKELPAVGAKMHTTVPAVYAIHKKLKLLDFPGSNGIGEYSGAWAQFASVSSAAVLLLKFGVRRVLFF